MCLCCLAGVFLAFCGGRSLVGEGLSAPALPTGCQQCPPKPDNQNNCTHLQGLQPRTTSDKQDSLLKRNIVQSKLSSSK